MLLLTHLRRSLPLALPSERDVRSLQCLRLLSLDRSPERESQQRAMRERERSPRSGVSSTHLFVEQSLDAAELSLRCVTLRRPLSLEHNLVAAFEGVCISGERHPDRTRQRLVHAVAESCRVRRGRRLGSSHWRGHWTHRPALTVGICHCCRHSVELLQVPGGVGGDLRDAAAKRSGKRCTYRYDSCRVTSALHTSAFRCRSLLVSARMFFGAATAPLRSRMRTDGLLTQSASMRCT